MDTPQARPTDPALLFIDKVRAHIGANEIGTDEQSFIVRLAGMLPYKEWEEQDYDTAVFLYQDYRACILVMGERARIIGFQATLAATVFQRPRFSLQMGALGYLLERVANICS